MKVHKFKPLDFIMLFIITAFVLFSLLITLLIKPPKGSAVEVYYDGEKIISESLETEKSITLEQSKYPKLLGDMVIEISFGRVRIAKETSPRNICSKQGWTDNKFKSLICEPNYIIVQITDDEPFKIPDEIPIGGIS